MMTLLHASKVETVRSKRRLYLGERLIQTGLFLCALLSVVTTVGIVWILVTETIQFFQQVSVLEFLTGTVWTPLFDPPQFGILPLVCGTFLVALGAGIVAIPIGVATAIYLSEYASKRIRNFLKPVLELLSGIPSVVYGYFAVTFVTPLLRKVYPQTEVFNAASAAIVVGIMILPMVASLCDDSMRAVPNSLRYAAYALGGTKFEISSRVVFPAALSGVIASFVLAISRAIGETMAVSLAAGSTPKLTANFFESIQTMTGYIVQVSLGDTPAGSIGYQTLFAVGMSLFLITFVMNLFAQVVLGRFREKYE